MIPPCARRRFHRPGCSDAGNEWLAAIGNNPASQGVQTFISHLWTVSEKDQDRDSARELGASGYFLKDLNYPEPTEFVKDLYGHWVRGEVPDYWPRGT